MSGIVVQHGSPTEEELGVVVTVIASAIASRVDPNATQHRPLRNWAAPAQFHRPALQRRGPGAWVRSGRSY